MKYELKKIKASCPLCSEKMGFLLFETNSQEVPQFMVKKERNPKKFDLIKKEIEKIWGKKDCKIVRCPSCSFTYSYPYNAGTPNYYSLIYDNLQYPTWIKVYEIVLPEIIKLSQRNKNLRYLEIGAGNGNFVKKVSKYIKKENILCLEYSRTSLKKINHLGIKCVNKNIVNLKTNNKFSIVCLFQVIHQLDNINKFFRKLKEITEKEAHVFISTSTNELVTFNETKLNFMALPPTYTGRWNKKAFEFISKKHGFKIVEYIKEYPSFTSFLKDMAFGIYTVKSKKSGSIPNKIYSIKNKFFRRLFSVLLIAYYLMVSLYLIPKRRIPTVQLIHLKKDY